MDDQLRKEVEAYSYRDDILCYARWYFSQDVKLLLYPDFINENLRAWCAAIVPADSCLQSVARSQNDTNNVLFYAEIPGGKGYLSLLPVLHQQLRDKIGKLYAGGGVSGRFCINKSKLPPWFENQTATRGEVAEFVHTLPTNTSPNSLEARIDRIEHILLNTASSDPQVVFTDLPAGSDKMATPNKPESLMQRIEGRLDNIEKVLTARATRDDKQEEIVRGLVGVVAKLTDMLAKAEKSGVEP